jgi:hypothetical protein
MLGSDTKNCQGGGEFRVGQEHRMSIAPVTG